jgi:putative membrane protein
MTATVVAAWVVGAWAPVDRSTWLLENLLVFGLAGLLALTHHRFVFSNLSYALVALFLLLHVLGSHYTYSAVPPGDWVRDALGLSRNHYDRFVHFAFGALCAYPMREITLRRIHVHGTWSYVVPVLLVLSMSASYEMIEWGAARLVDPDVGVAYVGAQGDVWDGQKDMALALLGAALCMALTAVRRGFSGREPYRHGGRR